MFLLHLGLLMAMRNAVKPPSGKNLLQGIPQTQSPTKGIYKCPSPEVLFTGLPLRMEIIKEFSPDKKDDLHSTTASLAICSYNNTRLFTKAFFFNENPNKETAEREERVLLKFQDLPGVVRLKFCTSTPECTILFMETLGDDLRTGMNTFLDRPLSKQLYMAYEMTMTIAEIHRRGRTHSDIKPENMLLSLDGMKLVLIDFGYSVRIGEIRIGGTPWYMPPEAFDESEGPITSRFDSWSWVIMLFELFCSQEGGSLMNEARSSGLETIYIYEEYRQLLFQGLKKRSEALQLPLDKVIGGWVHVDPANRPEMFDIAKGLRYLYWLQILKERSATALNAKKAEAIKILPPKQKPAPALPAKRPLGNIKKIKKPFAHHPNSHFIKVRPKPQIAAFG